MPIDEDIMNMKKTDFILDTDVGADCDDMYALAYLLYARRHLNVDIKAITHSNACSDGPATIASVFAERGEAIPPIGQGVGLESHDQYCREVAERFAQTARTPVFDAVTLLRRALSESDRATLCAIGPLTNIAALLLSEADGISPLDGVSLVREKCEKVVVMAGRFDAEEPEWNAKVDVSATQTFVRLCPVKTVFLPFEVGQDMLTGGPMIERHEDRNPVSMSFWIYGSVRKKGGRHSWDPATALYAVEGCGNYFDESTSGRVEVDDLGITRFTPGEGLCSILSLKKRSGLSEAEQRAAVVERLDRCVMRVYE